MRQGMDYLDGLSQLKKDESIYLYGAGSFSETFLSQLQYYRNDINIINFIDKSKRGKLNNIEIISPNNIPHNNKHKIIVCTNIDYWDDIHQSLGNKNTFFNRFHDFNIYRRAHGIKDNKSLKRLFRNSRQINTLLNCIEDQNIQPLVESKGLVDGYNKFFERIKLKPSDIIINGGGANGSENERFIEKIGTNGKIYTFDPNHNGKDLTRQVETHPYVLYNESGKINFHYNGSRSRVSQESGVIMDSISIDDFVCQNKIKKLNFIKLDTEGAEKEILIGARDSIKKFKPKLAICLYHSTADFFEIPILINEICDEYIFDLGIYDRQGIDTYLHAYSD